MTQKHDFDLQDFLPYLLNQAAEECGLEFQKVYKQRYGMLRTEWRVLFHLGRYGDMTAKDICDRARVHKTKVSRAVSALQSRGFLKRVQLEQDRRHERLSLTPAGVSAYSDLQAVAADYDTRLTANFSAEEQRNLRDALRLLARL
ncbi:MarR family winged helix-turn-helix transcriptional regulator [Candidatus Halocynthiibacter alkanivorans]|uniref:MarR family winged helix-turn-helix transcriptional regulator n=1 Tax=Candidatus Halocynthiibacter alkanivorans TaxID=2267619 RepID=UPI000DF29336|nr:MarR family transcriptional regulator [Candidatus Halocynthiibacter alkanivorans]